MTWQVGEGFEHSAGSLLGEDEDLLAEAVAGLVLDATGTGFEEPAIARLRGLPWSYGGKEV